MISNVFHKSKSNRTISIEIVIVTCATSFNDLKTVNGVQYSTFYETCLALGLIESDEEWNRTIQEAVT